MADVNAGLGRRFSQGICLMSGAASIMTEWRDFSTFVVISTLVYCAASAPFLKESPRWLLISGQTEKALEMLTGLAKGNTQSIPAGGLPPLVRQRDTKKIFFLIILT